MSYQRFCVFTAIAERIDKRRRHEDFQQRLQRLIDGNRRVLERLAE